MRVLRTLLHVITGFVMLGLAVGAPAPVRAAGATITVTTTAASGNDGECSLWEALQAASGNIAIDSCAAGSASDPDTVAFNIPTSDSGYDAISGVFTISLTNSTGGIGIYSPVVVDGTTQPGYVNAPVIRLNGDGNLSTLVSVGNGVTGSTLRGLMVTNAVWYAIYIGAGANQTTIAGNYINTDGVSQIPAAHYPAGVLIFKSDNVTVGGPSAADRNLISGNTGVQIDGGSSNVVQGNYFGVQADGITPIVDQTVNSSAVYVELNTGTLPSYNTIRDNVMAGFAKGIILSLQSHHNTIQGNKIGVGADGSTDLGMGNGILLWGSSYNTIGGPAAADRNIIAGNTNYQIDITDDGVTPSDGNVIQGNYIGTDASGESALDPSSNASGIRIESGDGNQVGGLNPGEGNVVAGLTNGSGIEVSGSAATNTVVQGNIVGMDKDGTNAIPNYNGLVIWDTSANAGDGGQPGSNLIAGNSTRDVYLLGATAGTTLAGNKIGVNAAGDGAPAGSVAETGIHMNNGASAQIANNWIANHGFYSINISATSTVDSGSADNCFINNGSSGLYNANTGADADFGSNWWGDASGPTHASNAGGTGDKISDHVLYSPVLSAAPAACAPVASLDAGSLSFAGQLVGTSSPARTVTLTNTGGRSMTIGSITTAAPFALGAGTCPAGGGTLASGASCTILVKISPTATGPASGNLTITSDAATSPDVVPLTGSGVAGSQLLKNTSFEKDDNHDNKPDSFTLANFNVATDKRDCSIRKAGSCSLKLAGNGKQKTTTQAILQSGSQGDDFTFLLWSKAVSVPGGGVYRLQVKFFNGPTLLATKTMNFSPGTHSFQKVSGTFTAPGAYTRVVYKIVFKAPSGTAWFDAASMKWAP